MCRACFRAVEIPLQHVFLAVFGDAPGVLFLTARGLARLTANILEVAALVAVVAVVVTSAAATATAAADSSECVGDTASIVLARRGPTHKAQPSGAHRVAETARPGARARAAGQRVRHADPRGDARELGQGHARHDRHPRVHRRDLGAKWAASGGERRDARVVTGCGAEMWFLGCFWHLCLCVFLSRNCLQSPVRREHSTWVYAFSVCVLR